VAGPTGWTRLRSAVPALDWLPRYERSRLGPDLLAGTVIAALVIPQALGYAAIAGVPVQAGLYAVPLALVAYAAFGSSRQLVVGPVSTVSVLSGSLVATSAGGDRALAMALTSALAVAGGLMLLAAGLLRWGWMAEFLSKPIITGFVFGLTLVIVIGELPSLLGVPAGPGNVVARLVHLAGALDEVVPATASVGAVSLAVLFTGGRLAPRVPWGLLLLVTGIAGSRLAGLADRGVAVVGAVPRGLPPLHVPHVPSELLGQVVVGGGALALVGLAEGLSAARLFATRNGYRVRSDAEFVAAGVSNLAAGLSGGLGVAGSLSKTAAADRAGARSQVAGLVTAALVVLTLLTVAGLLAPLPRAVLSAVVVHAVWGLMDVAALRRYAWVRRNDIVAAGVALVGVLAFGTLYGLLAAVGLSVLGVIYRSSRMDVEAMGRVPHEKAAWGSLRRHPERHPVPGVCVLRMDAPLFWVNAAQVHDLVLSAVEERPGTWMVLLDLESTNQIDTTSADMLSDLLIQLRARGIDLMLVRVFFAVRQVLRRSGFEDRLGPDRMWHSISQGIRAARALRPGALAAAETEPAADVRAGEDGAAPAPEDERIAVALDAVAVHGLTTGYEGDPPDSPPRWRWPRIRWQSKARRTG
jgi:SulP family sulfate permease